MSEWNNYGDVNFAEYGGIMVRQSENCENDYEFFELQVGDENKYAFHGTVCNIIDYADENVIKDVAADFGYDNVQDFIKENPERAVVELVESYGYGAMEFDAQNGKGEGQYSLNRNDFKLNDNQLVLFMEHAELPKDVIPSFKLDFSNISGDYSYENNNDCEMSFFEQVNFPNFTEDETLRTLYEVFKRADFQIEGHEVENFRDFEKLTSDKDVGLKVYVDISHYHDNEEISEGTSNIQAVAYYKKPIAENEYQRLVHTPYCEVQCTEDEKQSLKEYFKSEDFREMFEDHKEAWKESNRELE